MKDIIYKFNTSTKDREYLGNGLELYNFSKNEYLNPIIYRKKQKKFGFYAYVDNNKIGGAYGFIDDGYWTYLDLLFVEEKYRNLDVGTSLIKQVEQFAKDNNCVGIKTDTWSFQARGFYEKMGFVLYGELENHPPHATEYLLKKVLITDEKDFPEPIR